MTVSGNSLFRQAIEFVVSTDYGSAERERQAGREHEDIVGWDTLLGKVS